MTTELAILLALFLFIVVGGVLNNKSGIRATFLAAGPNLGARIEKHLETGAGFVHRTNAWEPPPPAR